MGYFTLFELKFDTANANRQTFQQLVPSAELSDGPAEMLREI